MSSNAVILLRIKLASLRGATVSEWESNRLKMLAGALTVLILVPGMYLLFRFLFGYVFGLEKTFPGFGEALSLRLLGMTFMSFGIFIAISSFISGVSVLFRSGETAFLMTLPVRDRTVSMARTLESWLHAGWATILLGFPIVVAFNVSLEHGLPAILISVVLFPLLVATWVAAGTMLLGLSVKLGRGGRHWKVASVLGAVVAAGIYLVLKGSGPSGILATDSSSLEAIHRFVAQLPAAGGRMWPHVLFSDALVSASSGEWSAAVTSGLLLAAEAVILGTVSLLLVCSGFRKIYSGVSRVSSRRKSSVLLLRRGGKLSTMLQKDLLAFIRDPVQWSQLLLLAGLFLVYAMNLKRFPMDLGHPLWRSVVIFLNFSFSSFVAATLLVRFAFPAISLEGPGLNYILQLPAGRKMLLVSKWTGSFMFILPLIAGTGLWTGVSLGAGNILLVSFTSALILMCVALVCINTGLGAVYPRFAQGSAASIASGQGGIIAAFASMGYVLVAISVLGWVIRTGLPAAGSERFLAAPMARAVVFLVIFTLVVSILSIRGARGSLARRDF